eukprot:249906_1
MASAGKNQPTPNRSRTGQGGAPGGAASGQRQRTAQGASHATPNQRQRTGQRPGSSVKRQASGRSKPNVHRNVHIKQEDPAIWDHFRARTVQGTSIYIGKNTIIGPGVNIIAEKGTITIGDNNIISEGTLIINKAKEELVIGNGNVFECGARIEAAKINDYNVFGAKCHVMSGALIGTGCVICPRVMIIAKKRVRDCMVVFGDNMVHEQPLMKKRNRAYIDQMVKVLRLKFKEIKQKSSKGKPSSRSTHGSSDRSRGTASSRQRASPGGATGSLRTRQQPGASASGKRTVSFASKSRPEVPVSRNGAQGAKK